MHVRRRAIFLVGFMGAGKTTVGRYVADRMHWRFVDLDDRIVAKANRSIPEIFESSGEIGFRQFENQALAELLGEMANGEPTVVGLGGGAYVDHANIALLEEFGAPVVFLDAVPEQLWTRTVQAGDARPLRTDENGFRQRYQERLPSYSRAGHRIDTTGKPVSEVAAEVVWIVSTGNSI